VAPRAAKVLLTRRDVCVDEITLLGRSVDVRLAGSDRSGGSIVTGQLGF
jgi:hypothetical protein